MESVTGVDTTEEVPSSLLLSDQVVRNFLLAHFLEKFILFPYVHQCGNSAAIQRVLFFFFVKMTS